METKTFFQQFRQQLYQSLPKRADATLDLIDALTVAGHVSSPVALSEEGFFRRKFSAIYDVLSAGRLEPERLRQNLTLYEQPEPKPAGSRGAPRKHGPAFKMAHPRRDPDQTSSF